MFRKKKITAISRGTKDPNKMNNLRSYLGRRVRSKSGESLGGIYDILFMGDKVEGYVVSKRLSKLFVGKEFFSSFSKKTAMLSIDPVILLIGKQVFDADGKKLGKVVRVERKSSSNDYESLVVRRNFFSRGIEVQKKDIDVSKKNIILKVIYE